MYIHILRTTSTSAKPNSGFGDLVPPPLLLSGSIYHELLHFHFFPVAVISSYYPSFRGLLRWGRVYAENVLGGGSPSKPVEVNLRAFLGHLRAQEEGRGKEHATSCTRVKTCAERQQNQKQRSPARIVPPAQKSPLGCLDPSISTTPTTSSADGVPSFAVTDNDASSCSKSPAGLTVGRKSHEQEQRREPPDGITEQDAQGGTPHVDQRTEDRSSSACTAVPSPAASAFAGDFMGLEGFGEARVHNLFAPPSPSRCRRYRPRAPAAGGVGVGSCGGNGPYPLPPIVLVSGISGENRGVNAAARGTHELDFNGRMPNEGVRWDDDRSHGGICGVAGTEEQLDSHGRSFSSSGTDNNDVFHAFINLGRRLPGRLRRDRDDP